MKNGKQIKQRFLRWSGVIACLIAILAGQYLYVQNAVAAAADDSIEKAAKVQLKTSAVKLCLEHFIPYLDGTVMDNLLQAGTARQGDIFHQMGSGPLEQAVSVGAWLDKEVGEDGIIYGKLGQLACNQNGSGIVKSLAQEYGDGLQDALLCHGAAPGLLTRVHSWWDGQPEGTSCNSFNDGGYNQWIQKFGDWYKINQGGVNHLGWRYEEWQARTQNAYTSSFYNIDNMSPAKEYYIYLNDYQTVCGNSESNDPNDHRFATPIKEVRNGQEADIYYKTMTNDINDDSWAEIDMYNDSQTCGSLANIINNKFNADRDAIIADVNKHGGNTHTDNTQPTNNNPAEPTCETVTNNSLGWIICPVLNGIGSLANTAYKDWIEPSLRIESKLFEQNNGTYVAWNAMRGFANIAMVIFLLIVIFSQLTNVGIDNYGIKKALPKIIVAAVLINLSYFACQILVDVSNIVGASLNSLLRGLGNTVLNATEANGYNFEATLPGGTFTVNVLENVVGIGVLYVIITKIAALIGGAGMALILPLLLVALTVCAAIFFFFALLAIRQVGVVLLTVLAPLAVVCYMLPNTKPLFDKWRKALTTLLVLYPICGLLVGGGHLASAILLTSGATNWFIALTGVIVAIAPVFAIPFLVKSTMNAFGTIGGKLAGLTGAGRKLSGKIKETDAYKNKYTAMAGHTNPYSKFGRARARFANSKFGRATGAGVAYGKNIEAAQKLAEERTKAQQATMVAETNDNADRAATVERDTIRSAENWSAKRLPGPHMPGDGENGRGLNTRKVLKDAQKAEVGAAVLQGIGAAGGSATDYNYDNNFDNKMGRYLMGFNSKSEAVRRATAEAIDSADNKWKAKNLRSKKALSDRDRKLVGGYIDYLKSGGKDGGHLTFSEWLGADQEVGKDFRSNDPNYRRSADPRLNDDGNPIATTVPSNSPDAPESVGGKPGGAPGL